MTTETVLTILVLGGAGGWFFGRWWAEDARAEDDMERIWRMRHNYRLPPEEKKK